jgi:putative membrane protein
MKWGRLLVAFGGLAIAGYLVAQEGFGDVAHALQLAGWAGLGAITLFHAIPTVLCGIAWALLLRRHEAGGWFLFTWVRWIRDGIDGVLPVLPVSGELVGTRILALRGVELAGASVVVDLTAELLSQVLFAVIGLVLLMATHPEAPYQLWIALGIGVMALQFTGFLVAQRKGLFRLIERPLDWLRRHRRQARSDAERTLHDRILSLYGDGPAFAGCILLHLLAWLIGGLETWIGLWFMGHPLGVAEVLAIEGLVYALRSVTFFIPLGAGVQEGGYVLIGGLLGLPSDLALAVSLLKRGRDLAIGLPALLLWQIIEGHAFRRARRSGDLAT